MRVLIAHSFYRVPGGEDRYVRDQEKLLSESGHESRLLHHENVKLKSGLSVAAKITYSRAQVNRVRAELRSFNPDIVHLHNPYPSFGPAVHLAAEAERKPLVMTIHNMRLRCPNGFMFTEGAICRRCQHGAYFNAAVHKCFPERKQGAAYALALWHHRFVLRLEKKVSAFVPPSEFMADRLVQWGIPRPKIRRIPYPFTDLVPKPAAPGRSGAFLGRISQEKGVILLLEALAKLHDPPFVVAGDGPLLSTARARAGNLGLRNVEFLGHLGRRDLDAVIDRSGFVVIPSVWEDNYPFAAIESMARGRGIIVSDLGGLPEMASEGRGSVFRAGDAHALSDEIRRFSSDEGLRAESGLAGHSFVTSKLAPSTHVRELETLYLEVTARAPN